MTNPSPRSCQLLSHLPFLPSPPLLFPPSDFPSTLPPPPCDVFPVPSLVGSVHVDSSLSLQTRDSISAGVPSHLPNPPHHSLEWRKAAKRPRTNSFVTKNSQVLKMRGMQLVNTITETFLLSLLYSYIYVCIYVCMYVLYVLEGDWLIACSIIAPSHPLYKIESFTFVSSPSLVMIVMIPFLDAAEELADQVSQLVLDPRDRTVETRVQTKCSLPKIPSSHTHRPSILTYNTGKSRTNCKSLPILLEEGSLLCMMMKLLYLLLQLLLSHCHQL